MGVFSELSMQVFQEQFFGYRKEVNGKVGAYFW